MKSTKGFVDLGLTVILAWGVMAGIAVFGTVYDEVQTRKVCARGGVVQIGESLYECKKTQTLGEKPKVQIVEKVVEKVVTKKCPKCKPQIPCDVPTKPGEPKNLMCVEAPK